METFLYLEINALGLIVLAILLRNQSKLADLSREHKIFNDLMISLMVMLVFDSLMWLVDGASIPFSRELNYLVSSVYYFFNCFIPFLWFLYTAFYFQVYNLFFRRFKWLTCLPLMLNTAFILLNLRFDILFVVDEGGWYHRGTFFILPVVLAFVYLLLSAVLSVVRIRQAASEDERRKSISILLFLLLPVFGGIIQSMYYGFSLIWICVVLSCLLVFVNVQNGQMCRDALTGLYNRYQFDRYLIRRFEDPGARKAYALVMIDVDKFKQINDSFGHLVGDRALVSVADILKKSCANKRTFLSRYGGDEFTVICPIEMVCACIAKIQKNVEELNARSGEKFALSLSIGYASFADAGVRDTDDLIAFADKDMYKHKG